MIWDILMQYAKAYQRPVRRYGMPLLGGLPGVAPHRWHMVREDSRSAVSVPHVCFSFRRDSAAIKSRCRGFQDQRQ